jgi:hypothetical protein
MNNSVTPVGYGDKENMCENWDRVPRVNRAMAWTHAAAGKDFQTEAQGLQSWHLY